MHSGNKSTAATAAADLTTALTLPCAHFWKERPRARERSSLHNATLVSREQSAAPAAVFILLPGRKLLVESRIAEMIDPLRFCLSRTWKASIVDRTYLSADFEGKA